MSNLIAWSYDPVFRTKNSAGAALHYFVAYDDGYAPRFGPVVCGPITTGDEVQLPREGWDYSEDPLPVGVHKKIMVRWELASYCIKGSPSTDPARSLSGCGTKVDNLGTILADLVTGGTFLEVSLIPLSTLAGDGRPTYRDCVMPYGAPVFRVCYVAPPREFTSVTGKNVVLGLELTFVQKALTVGLLGVSPLEGNW
jgi:hypothetical protein